MAHPFKDKLFVFIGNPKRCSRQAARSELINVGGVVDERITTFTHYIVAFEGAEKTKVYQKAVDYDNYGHMVLLNEEQFFDILENKATPPEKKKPKLPDGIIVMPAKDPDAITHEYERAEQYVLAKKRIKNMVRYGAVDNGSNKVGAGFNNFESIFNFASNMIKSANYIPMSIAYTHDNCSSCGNPSKIHMGDGKGNDLFHLCNDCYNELMAQILGTESPADMPKRLDFQFKCKTYRFAIEAEIFVTGKVITATEIGKIKRKTDVSGELDDDFGDMLETLKKRIKKLVSTIYMGKDGRMSKSKAVGYVEYNSGRQAHDIVIDGKPYTWAELEKNVSMHEGWKIKIEFGDIGDELD